MSLYPYSGTGIPRPPAGEVLFARVVFWALRTRGPKTPEGWVAWNEQLDEAEEEIDHADGQWSNSTLGNLRRRKCHLNRSPVARAKPAPTPTPKTVASAKPAPTPKMVAKAVAKPKAAAKASPRAARAARAAIRGSKCINRPGTCTAPLKPYPICKCTRAVC